MRHDPAGAVDLVWWWTFDPTILATVGATSAVYARGVANLWREAGKGHGVRSWQVACFAAGQAVVLIALLSPIDALSDALFSAHMTQHELLMIVAAPLVVFGRPLVAMLWGLPAAWRAPVGRFLQRPTIAAAWRATTHPLVVLVAHGAVVWAWHARGPFEAALHDEAIHAVQHLSFFASAALFWWSLLHGRFGRVGYGVSVAFVFATAMHTSLLGALITVARSLWYPAYVEPTVRWGRDPMEDQQLAGILMWVPAGALLAAVALALFAAWLREAERRSTLRDRSARLRADREGAAEEALDARPRDLRPRPDPLP